jgi:hypothetical protein
MIKRFRKLRQKMLAENRFSKYLLYAIGEIVLVIIGILIALAINQKNTDENNDELRDLYLVQLIDETERNIEELTARKDYSTKKFTELDTLFQLLINKDYDNPKLLSKSKQLYGRTTFVPIMTTYENLKFSGDLKLFNDIGLRNSISETYNAFNHIKTMEKIDLEVIDVYYQDYYMSNARIIDLNLSSENFGKDGYFENTVYVRKYAVRQLRDAYEDSIRALKKLKSIYADFQKSK